MDGGLDPIVWGSWVTPWRAEIGGEPVGLGGGVGDNVLMKTCKVVAEKVGDWREADTAEPQLFLGSAFDLARRRRRGACPGASVYPQTKCDTGYVQVAMGTRYSHLTLGERCRLCGLMEMGF